jgi:DNA-binding response OmpR family regulator
VLDIQGVAPPSRLFQVGTFLATIDFEETKLMTDSHLPASKRTIMVVDDDPDIVEVVRLRLESKGFNVRCAYSGQQVFADLGEQKPDLIILDIMMPNMDGLKVLTRLKGDLSTASIPVILLTAKAHYYEVLEGYKTGADCYITKPYTKAQLLSDINLLLSKHQGDSVESP